MQFLCVSEERSGIRSGAAVLKPKARALQAEIHSTIPYMVGNTSIRTSSHSTSCLTSSRPMISSPAAMPRLFQRNAAMSVDELSGGLARSAIRAPSSRRTRLRAIFNLFFPNWGARPLLPGGHAHRRSRSAARSCVGPRGGITGRCASSSLQTGNLDKLSAA